MTTPLLKHLAIAALTLATANPVKAPLTRGRKEEHAKHPSPSLSKEGLRKDLSKRDAATTNPVKAPLTRGRKEEHAKHPSPSLSKEGLRKDLT